MTAIDAARQQPTPASVWQALSGTTIGREALDWPPDLLAMTEVILQRSEAYRFALSPPGGSTWPPADASDWPDAVTNAGRQWSAWAEDRTGTIPPLLAQEWAIFCQDTGIPLSDLTEARNWRLCQALLTLHAIADEACAGLGVALDASDADGLLYRARGRELLARTGSLARLPTHLIRVLPKIHTPPNGSSVRSLSRYAAVHAPGVEARWYKVPGTGPDARLMTSTALLLPWPLRVRESDFRPVPGPLPELAGQPFGFFEFAPSERLDLDLVDRMLAAALDEVDTVNAVILPESALDADEIDGLEALLGRQGVTGLITGVRGHPEQPGQFPRNWVHIGVSTGQHWVHIRQHKHHRWSLNENQIHQYHLGGALHPHVRWWEAMDLPRRSVQFVEIGDGATLTSLVCEDLAQIDDAASVIRSVGPMIVVTPVLDGPQLSSRWAARYASVLADDPGSAVLTLTSIGMARRSQPPGQAPSAVVALWKEPGQGIREISLEPGAHGILLSASADRATRHSYDGRRPVKNGSKLSSVSIYQVRPLTTSPRAPAPQPRADPPPPLPLDAGDLSILTCWAEAAADALAFAPERIQAVTADTRPGAPWRARLRLAEPSLPLRDAIDSMLSAIRVATAAGGGPSPDALLAAIRDRQPGEPGTDTTARLVLRAALEQRRTQQAIDHAGLPVHTAAHRSPREARRPTSTPSRSANGRRQREHPTADRRSPPRVNATPGLPGDHDLTPDRQCAQELQAATRQAHPAGLDTTGENAARKHG